MTIKFNDLAATARLVALPGTFGAIVAFCEEYSQKEGPTVTVGTLVAGLATATEEFYSPVLPRGLRLNTAEEVAVADLDAQRVRVALTPEAGEPELIVSGHPGTREVLIERFPTATVVAGNVGADDIVGKAVVGTLPPHLVAETRAYVPVSVREFDYTRDGDLAGEELLARLVIGSAVRVTVE